MNNIFRIKIAKIMNYDKLNLNEFSIIIANIDNNGIFHETYMYHYFEQNI